MKLHKKMTWEQNRKRKRTKKGTGYCSLHLERLHLTITSFSQEPGFARSFPIGISPSRRCIACKDSHDSCRACQKSPETCCQEHRFSRLRLLLGAFWCKLDARNEGNKE